MTSPSLLKKYPALFTLIFLWIIFGCWYLLTFPKGEGFLQINPVHTPALDHFFIYFTWFGDGLFVILVGLICIFIQQKKLGTLIIISFLFSGLIAQVIKKIVIAPRPAVFFQNSDYPYFIPDVTLFNYHSFPSGHTTSIFALVIMLALSVKNQLLQISLFVFAIAVGYSRIYLGQHFPEDVLSGSVIGIFSALLCYKYLIGYKKPFIFF